MTRTTAFRAVRASVTLLTTRGVRVRAVWKSDLLVTVTRNLVCPEIAAALLESNTPQADRVS